ncbi:MAG: alpha-1,6-glucosidase [Micrococcales bacterium 73-15]|uniref:pullulanase-type alpha-1,6-glucosidase n=1 Tax=Salana multivorans TaxID=120377 RepID=UPI000969FC78|nr:pullulanase-type alpha-1,6-glucosidase [Salana multivorans]OJX93918.1 MAG: alpha-1,6-glucosidase [Micrococcales bacterium 73-15]
MSQHSSSRGVSTRRQSRRPAAALAALALAATGLGAALAATPVAPAAAAPRPLTLVGSLQSELGCAGDWQPECTATDLAPTGTDGVYAAEFTLPAGSYEYKVTYDHAWEESYGREGGSGNTPLVLAGETRLRFTFDATTKRTGLVPLDLAGDVSDADSALVADPVRQAGGDEVFYFVMTDRFANGDITNDRGSEDSDDRLVTGLDPTDKGFYHGGDIAGLRDRLDYIEGLGTTAIWLTPSFKNRPVQGTGADASAGYHGYWVTDFTQIDPHLGTNDELADFIDAAHDRDIKVYFDIITNHTADVISYQEGQYGYVPQASSPYRDANGNPFDPADYAGTDTFPELDAATSFPYTPVIDPADADLRVPAWLNDPTLYHNRGDSTWEGESVTYGDFSGLDDLFTEHPTVVDGFIDVYDAWVDLGIDGFRIDTVKHVNFEFWQAFTAAVSQHATAVGNPDFFMFGEVYDADPVKLSPYVRRTQMDSVLDFYFQQQALTFASGGLPSSLSALFAGDDYYTTPTTSASALPSFLGNHDMGRVGYFLSTTDNPLERSELAHELMFLTRGQPVVYYGDEQGFAGTGGDKDARQDMFATQVAEYANQPLVTGVTAGSVDRFDTSAPLYRTIADVAALRAQHPALSDGAQIERLVDSSGVYAFSRVDRDEKVEYLVVANNAAAARTVDVPTLTADATFAPLYPLDGSVTGVATGTDAVASVTVPARSAVVLRADGTVTAPAAAAGVTVSTPTPGASIDGLVPVSASADDHWRETSFAWRVVGDDEWTQLGTAETTKPRVFHDTAGLADGTLVEYRAVSLDAAGNVSAASSYGSVRVGVTTTEPEEPGPSTYDAVSVPGSHNSEMGCSADWQPGCTQAQLTLRPDGIWSGTFDLPAGDYEYKVAIDGSWDLNFGAGGVKDGPNVTYTHAGGPITFYFDPVTNRFSNTSSGPIITLAGDFQSELGCPGDWQPASMCAWLQDDDGDGIYTFSTTGIPTGAYEVKVAHGLSWDENYGVDGARDGSNYRFSATGGKVVAFSYEIARHLLTITVEDPPLPGTGELRAHWVGEDLLAWPRTLGVASGASWSLHHSADATLAVADGAVTGGSSIDLTPVDLPAEVTERFPALAGYQGLALPDDVDRDAVRELLTEQVWVSQSADGALTAATGVQVPGVLDDLYAAAVRDVELGVVFAGDAGRPVPDAAPGRGVPAAGRALAAGGTASARLWAPTAQSVELQLGAGGGEPSDDVPASLDPVTGVWSVPDGTLAGGDTYRWVVTVYAPTTGRIETNTVTDPYSHALTLNSLASVAVDLSDPATQPAEWVEETADPVANAASRAIWELHVRDFSIGDASVPADERGTYKAFTHEDSAGMTHLTELAEAGLTTVHLLPTFDIASIEEDRDAQTTPDCDLAALSAADPAGTQQQACVGAQRGTDGYNWGYDPWHYLAPEGSYASDPDGAARVTEFREMVGALHSIGLEVVLDQVYNHTAASGQAEKSVLDRVVPGYYHRLDAGGSVQTSTCCQNIATEHEVAEKLMVDSIVMWARDYKVDGFRFDLMGHHSRENMLAIRDALDELTLADDGVDGSRIYLYGEGWNFGEVANNALFEQATQGQLGGTGIGSFNDRLRDAVHGGGPLDGDSLFDQGFGTGLATDPNGKNRTDDAALGHLTDLVKLGMAGNLRDYVLLTSDGTELRGDQIDYNGAPAGYADSPEESVNYVDAHDNQTLYDIAALKLPQDTSMTDRVRMNTVQLATVTLGQSPSFWHAGTELLRSKSLDRNSYDSGDWFNRIDWTGAETTFGSGLPPAWDNESAWARMTPYLSDASLAPDAAAIAAADGQAQDLLRVRSEVDLLTLGSAELIEEKVSFPGSGPDEAPGTLAMLVDDTIGESASDTLDAALVLINASPEAVTRTFPELVGRPFVLTPAQADGSDPVVADVEWDEADGSVVVPARSYLVLVEADETEPSPTPSEPSTPPTDGSSGPTGGPTDGSSGPTGGPTDGSTAPTGGSTGSTGGGTAAPGAPGGPGGIPTTGVTLGLLGVAALLLGAGALLVRRRRALG